MLTAVSLMCYISESAGICGGIRVVADTNEGVGIESEAGEGCFLF
jgi:hypothetical protein